MISSITFLFYCVTLSTIMPNLAIKTRGSHAGTKQFGPGYSAFLYDITIIAQ